MSLFIPFGVKGSKGWPFGKDGNLVITSGQTVNIAAGSVKDYKNISVLSGGVLNIDCSSSANITVIGCEDTFLIEGTVTTNGTYLLTAPSIQTPDKAGLAWSINPTAKGGNGGTGSNLTSGYRLNYGGAGGSGNTNGGGGGGGGAGDFDGRNMGYGGEGGAGFSGGGGGGGSNGGAGGSAGASGAGGAGEKGGGGGSGGGAGAGSRGGNAPQYRVAGGGGGGGGGYKGKHAPSLYINANKLIITGNISFNGKDGFPGGSGGSGISYGRPGAAGGGGPGGNGGTVWVRAKTKSGLEKINVAGGAGGWGANYGQAGASGQIVYL